MGVSLLYNIMNFLDASINRCSACKGFKFTYPYNEYGYNKNSIYDILYSACIVITVFVVAHSLQHNPDSDKSQHHNDYKSSNRKQNSESNLVAYV